MKHLKLWLILGLLLIAPKVEAAAFPKPCDALNPTNCSRGTWGAELRDFFDDTYNLDTGYQISPFADVRAFGAKCDGVTNDSTAIQSAINASKAVLLPPGTCLIATGLTLPEFHILRGSGWRGSVLKYTGSSGYAVTFGSISGAASYGNGGSDFAINFTKNGGNGIRLAGTNKAYLRDIYIEGIPVTNTSVGVWIDGAVASNLFTDIQSVNVNHTKFGLDLSSSGVGQVTSAIIDIKVFCDLISGSIGINIAASHGDGVLISGGNAESCATGINQASSNVSINGFRFEGNTIDLRFETTAQYTNVENTHHLETFSDASGHCSNGFLLNQTASGQMENRLCQLTLWGNLTFQRVLGGHRYIVLDASTTGDMIIQAGPGSTALGGSIVLNGSSNASPGSVIAGLGGSGVRDFSVNSAGFGDGTKLFSVNQVGMMTNVGIAFTNLGTPANGSFTYCPDCTVANPCASGGTGAFAKRLNGVWICN